MIFELDIQDGKEKLVINFLKQLDFVKVKSVRKSKKKPSVTPSQGKDLSYFGTMPEWDMDIRQIRKEDTAKRIKEWL